MVWASTVNRLRLRRYVPIRRSAAMEAESSDAEVVFCAPAPPAITVRHTASTARWLTMVVLSYCGGNWRMPNLQRCLELLATRCVARPTDDIRPRATVVATTVRLIPAA